MATASELIRMAARRAGQLPSIARPPQEGPPVYSTQWIRQTPTHPAPSPLSSRPATFTPPPPPSPAPPPPPLPRFRDPPAFPIRRPTIYTELMRKHDRVNGRHVR